MVRATLRDALGAAPMIRYQFTRYQDAVPFFVDNSLTQTGATASNAVVKQWVAKGGRVLAKSRPVPIKHIIASPYMAAEDMDKVKEYFLNLDTTDEGRKKLESLKYQGFAPYNQVEMLKIGTWLGL
jgi:ABC-type phosphate/phosphonate transport system substrate-binding protein